MKLMEVDFHLELSIVCSSSFSSLFLGLKNKIIKTDEIETFADKGTILSSLRWRMLFFFDFFPS
jgi:hypothetical protein